jgi:hypothetical protein
MTTFIHEQNKNNNTKQHSQSSYYSTINSYDFIDEDNNPRIEKEDDARVLAKEKIKSDGNPKYLIRLNNHKKLYDPTVDLSENKSNDLFQYDNQNVDFKEVSKTTFNLYLSFLRTMNVSWIRNAEREDF